MQLLLAARVVGRVEFDEERLFFPDGKYGELAEENRETLDALAAELAAKKTADEDDFPAETLDEKGTKDEL